VPYIPKDRRDKYDDYINRLAHILNNLEGNDEIGGEMTYVLFRLARLLGDEDSGGQRRFARLAVIRSALTEARDEFRKRVLDPYEKEKERQNGDVEL
jgi:hypothetical protein